MNRPVPTSEELRERIDRLLDEPVSLHVDRSPDGTWACAAPPADRPSGTVSVTVHRMAATTDRGWPVPEILPGTQVWGPAGAVLAGYREHDGVPCVVRPDDRSVSSFDAPPAGPLPMSWLDRHRLVVPVPVAEEGSPVRAPAVFEAGRFSRVRVLPADTPRGYALRILDTREGAVTADVPLPAAPYRALRTCACGDHLAAGTDDAVVLVDLRSGRTYSVDTPARPVGFSWVSRGATEFLVTVLSTQDGTEVRARAPDGSHRRVMAVSSDAVLDHVFEPRGPCLLLGDPGTGAASRLVLVGPETGGLSSRSWRIRGSPLVHGRIALVDRSTGLLRVAAVETRRAGSRVRLLTEPDTESGTLRADRRWVDATGQGLLDVVDWTGGTVRLVGRGRNSSRVVQLRAGRREPAAVELTGPARDGGARVWLHPPADGRPPTATAVSLLPRLAGPAGHRVYGLLAEHVHWLTRLGFAVAAVDVPLRWWPDVPDEQIRPGIVSAIAASVTETALAHHANEGRLVIHGHSFAATMALQALADTELFAAAMVSAGGYCRSLTPLGFQYEKRTVWEAPRVYQDFDAVLSAPRIRRPVLIVHGQRDRNPATPPEQAVLLFQSLTALGTPSRLVLLPEDGHHVRTRDGRATVLREQATWMYRWATGGRSSNGVTDLLRRVDPAPTR